MVKNLLLAFLKGVLAGLSIGLGGFLFVLMSFALPNELGKVLGSFLFAIGLFLVCTFGLSLYTGKVGMLYEKKQEKVFYLSLPIMLIGNAVGAFGLGYIMFAIFQNTALMDTAVATASSRLVFNDFYDYLSCCVRSFLCGVCVYLAVKSFTLNRLKPIGIILLVFFVFLFVYSGFQHCIANMFYFGFGNKIQPETFINLALVIIFNSIGPIVGVLLVKALSNIKK